MSETTTVIKEVSENGIHFSPDDSGSVEEDPEDTILLQQTSVNLVPYIGQRFVSQDAAYEFYCSFAKQCGFSIRRHRTRGKDGVGRGVTRRDFTCHRGGYPQLKPSDEGKAQRNRKSSRCGCQAYMRIVKRADFDVPEWRITGFSNVHNHDLLKSNEVQLLPAYCTMSADDKSRICMFAKAGMSVRQMLRLMELEKGVKLGTLPFTEVDVRNLLQSFRNVDRDNDAIDLLKLCKEKKDNDPHFKYNFKMDANNSLECIAWSYGTSILSYEAFGDTILFDTTKRLECYDMLLGIWVGVDNHGRYSFFGCVLLRDENLQSFSWALKTFLGFMNEKSPETILTDQNMWLKEAIAAELPMTKHAFCIWHIISKFSDWFSSLLGPQYDGWKAELHRLYNLHSVEEFELGWRNMVNTYGLHRNKHIISLYALRSYWALPFLRSYFFAGMSMTFQPETINAYLQRFLSAHFVLDNFLEQVAALVESQDQAGDKHKAQYKSQKASLKTGSPIESHAAEVLTAYAFNKLQEELVSAPQYASLMVDENCFLVRHHTEMDGGCKVLWDPHDKFISCSCRHFEFSGMLCRHVLRVLSANNRFHIPDQYLPVRWRETATALPKIVQATSSGCHNGKYQLLNSMISTLITESMETKERLDVVCDQITLVLAQFKGFPGPSDAANDIPYDSPSDSLILQEVEESEGIAPSFSANSRECVTSSHTKESRLRDDADAYRKRRRSLSCYGQYSHNANECPMLGADDVNGDSLGYL